MADLVEVGERGIDHAGARRIEACRALLQRLDDLVAVARTLGEQRQDDQLQVARGELAPGAEPAADAAEAAFEPGLEAAMAAESAATVPAAAEPLPPAPRLGAFPGLCGETMHVFPLAIYVNRYILRYIF
jgi:hypothetical protein